MRFTSECSYCWLVIIYCDSKWIKKSKHFHGWQCDINLIYYLLFDIHSDWICSIFSQCWWKFMSICFLEAKKKLSWELQFYLHLSLTLLECSDVRIYEFIWYFFFVYLTALNTEFRYTSVDTLWFIIFIRTTTLDNSSHRRHRPR